MNPNTGRNNKLLTIVLVVLGFAVVGAIAYLLITLASSKSTAYLSDPFVQNINKPFKIDANQLYFTTGHGFASLNTNNSTTQLGATRTLPKNPTSVEWTKTGAAMQASNYTIFDDLGSLVPATNFGSSDKPTYAWYVPFEGAPVVLDKNTSSLYADANTGIIYYLWKINPAADGALLRTYSTKDGTRGQFMPQGISGSFRIVYTAGDYVWALYGYGKDLSLIKYGKDGTETEIARNVFNSDVATVNSPLVMISESYFVAVQQDNQKAVLFTYDVGQKKRIPLNKDFTGTLNRGSGSAIYANSTTSNKAVTLRITGVDKTQETSVVLPEGSLTHVFDWGNNKLGVNLLKQASLISSNQAVTQNLPKIKSAGLEKAINSNHQGTLYTVSIDLSNAATSNSYSVDIYPPYAQNQSILLEDIKAAGYDLNQLDIVLNQTVKRQ